MAHARVSLGRSGIEVVPLGVGAWQWGDKRIWGYESEFGPREVVDAFTASIDAGLDFIDTAEVYGHGESEKIVGWMVRKSGRALVVATKFALLPGRHSPDAFGKALDASLRRLGLERIDLYQIHWPDSSMATIDALMASMAIAVGEGRVRAVGVSNFSRDEMLAAHENLAKRGIPLASNQVHYSLLHRAPEADGVLKSCSELGITLIAYSPLEQGLLSGRYAPGRLPPGLRAQQGNFSPENVAAAQPVLDLAREIGGGHGKTVSQVALRWLLERENVIVIPGAKSGAHAEDNAGALGWSLTGDEREALDRATTRWIAAGAE